MSDFAITPISALADNYIWLIHNDTHAIIIDAGDADPILDFLKNKSLQPVAFIITHEHNDHVAGLPKLKHTYPSMRVYGHSSHHALVDIKVDEGDGFRLCGLQFNVWRTAGHTDTHLSYLVNIDDKTHVFCGDTLFSGGCGRVFSGTITQLYESLERFNTLACDTCFYPAHEYTLSNLDFGQKINPTNTNISDAIYNAQALRAHGKPTLPTTLSHERDINVFLHTDNATIINKLKQLNELGDDVSALAVFAALRTLKNKGIL